MNPKKTIIYLALIITSLISAKSATAQINTSDYQISGTVADSITQRPLNYITVNLKTDQNTPVKATLTKADGSFVFTGLKPLKYRLTFSAVGHQTKSITVDATQKNTSLGTIFISSQTNHLKEIAITADKPIIKQEIDRISYDLQADPESKVSSVLEMLRKVPFVSLDGDENIQLKGNTSFKILINGKPSSMVERDPKNILRSIPASTIQRIEVITIPPSKYDAEGLAGIINIITNKKIDNGYNGTINFNDRFPGGPGVGTSFTVKEGKFGVNAFGGGSIYNSPETNYQNTRITSGTNPTNLAQQGTGKSDGRSGYFGTELSYEIDSLNLISGQFNINGDKSNGSGNQVSQLAGAAGILQGYDLGVANNGTGKGLDASLNYQLGFKANKAQLLTFSYRYSTYSNFNNTDIAITNPVNYSTPNYNQPNNTNSSEQTFQIDYVQPLKKWNIEAGIKGILRDNRSEFQYNSFDSLSNQFELDMALSNKYNSTQNILAAYNTWQYTGKNWGVKAGARIEQTVTDANFISTASAVHQNYLNVIPSVVFNFNFNNSSGINWGYTQRIKRPGINQLNPFVDRSNPAFQSSGNPDLQAILINTVQLGYHLSKKIAVNINLTYDFAKNVDLPVSTFDPATQITYTTFENTAKVDRYAGFFNINYPITKKWNFVLNGMIIHFLLSGPVDGVLQTNNFFAKNFATSTNYLFANDWRVSAEFAISAGSPTGLQGSRNGFAATTFSVNKSIVKNKLSFSAAVRNPFTKYRYSHTNTHGIDFTQTMLNRVYFRSGSVSLNYNFGKLKEEIKKNKRGINNDDLSK